MKFLAQFCSFLCLTTGRSAPFEHDLHLFSIPGANASTMICFHGYGANYQIAEEIKKLGFVRATLVGFNFPDHDLQQRDYSPEKATFGTIQELLPAAYVLKKYIVDNQLDTIDIYSRSAGGGAFINLIGVLNRSIYDKELEQVGITKKEKTKILEAIQRGIIILDVPLKSVEEIIDFRGSTPELEILARN